MSNDIFMEPDEYEQYLQEQNELYEQYLQKQADLLKLLSWLCDSLQKTIILTSHNPNHPTYINSLVILLYEHTIVAGGKATDVFQEELIQKVYGENVVIRPDGFIDINITQQYTASITFFVKVTMCNASIIIITALIQLAGSVAAGFFSMKAA